MHSTLKITSLFLIVFALASCTVYTFKDSEALSQAVYHADDSFDKGRFDLTDESLNQAVRIAKPPKKRIEVGEIVVKPTPTKTTPSSTSSNQRVVIVPSRFGSSPIIVVGTTEYKELLKDKQILKQLEVDHANLKTLIGKVDEELRVEKDNAKKTTEALNVAKADLGKKDAALLKLWIAVVVLVGIIVGGVYLRIKGIL